MSLTRTYRVELRDAATERVISTFTTDGDDPFDGEAHAELFANLLRNGSSVQSGQHDAVVVEDPLTRVQVWDLLTDLTKRTDDPLPVPMQLDVFGWGVVQIRFEDNERGHVDAWASELQLPFPELKVNADYGHYVVGGIGVDKPSSPILSDWSVQVSCTVRLNADVSAHGDGLASPEPAEYQAWQTARDAAQLVAESTDSLGTATEYPVPPKATGYTKHPDGSYDVTLSCGTEFANIPNRTDLDQLVGDHALTCTGQHDWTHEDGEDEPTDEPLPDGVEGIQLGRAAEAALA